MQILTLSEVYMFPNRPFMANKRQIYLSKPWQYLAANTSTYMTPSVFYFHETTKVHS